MCVCVSVCVCTYVWVCVYVCMFVILQQRNIINLSDWQQHTGIWNAHSHTYTHTHTHSLSLSHTHTRTHNTHTNKHTIQKKTKVNATWIARTHKQRCYIIIRCKHTQAHIPSYIIHHTSYMDRQIWEIDVRPPLFCAIGRYSVGLCGFAMFFTHTCTHTRTHTHTYIHTHTHTHT